MQELYSPVESYKSCFKQLHNDNTTKLFNKLVDISKIDIESNRKTSKERDENSDLNSNNDKAIKSSKRFKIISIVLIAVSIFGIIYTAINGLLLNNMNMSYGIQIAIVILFALLTPLLALSIKRLNRKLEELRSIEDKLLKKDKELCAEAEEQMRPLNDLLRKNFATQLFSETIPLVQFDSSFNNKRLDYMVGHFGFDASEQEHNMEQSTLFVQSGEIQGNPFLIRNYLQHTMGTKRYTGTRHITWTTRHTNSEGKTVTKHHSQTLQATVKKPCPYYHHTSYLTYANRSGERLSFSRKPSHIHKLDEKKIEKLIDKRSKELQRLAEKSTHQGGSFTPLGNNEFDSLFYAKDRDNEAQFRLLFTPLAQQQLIQVLTDNTTGFGDDFTFSKDNMINHICPEHLNDMKLDVDADYFTGLNYEQVKERFLSYHNSYFRHVFFTFAPIFAIPLYTQHQTQEYIYKDLYEGSMNFYQHEMAVNRMDPYEINPPESETSNIVKTSFVSSKNNTDTISVQAWGYRTIARTDYVSVIGDDNRSHDVPVQWTEYIRVDRETQLQIETPNGTGNNFNI